jgi:hypothetical protein
VFDDSLCQCDTLDTTGQFAKCPLCHPERYTDPVRLLAWLDLRNGLRDARWLPGWRHVWSVASSWLDPPAGGYPMPARVRRILADLESKDPARVAGWCVEGSDRPRLTGEATRAVLWDGTEEEL